MLGLQSTGLSDLIAGSSRYWFVGLALSLHLFDQGKNKLPLKSGRHSGDGKLADYEQSVLTAIGEFEVGLVAFSWEHETLWLFNEAVTSGSESGDNVKGTL